MTQPSSTSASLEVSRADLAQALKIVARVVGKAQGDARLRFEGGHLSIEAFGTVASAPARGVWPVPIFVRSSWVRRLARRMPSGDPLRLEIKEDRIYLERYSEVCALTPTEVPPNPDLPQIDQEWLIEEAARILKPLLIKKSDLEELASEARAKGTASWSTDEKRMTALVAKAWVLLAPLGIETTDIRRLMEKTVRDAWK
ncbi:MAG TPA: hypothetical protein VFC39_05440 [Acidobacteriaceae bacterium]|nr:hypothetical protein [Acidobacteriaceae bacterium]